MCSPTEEAGSSTVEMALLAPLLGAMLLYAIHLAELGHARIRQEELARYTAWEMTARQLSDLDDARHEERFAAVRAEVAAEAARRWRDLRPQEREERDLAGAATVIHLTRPPEVRASGLSTRAELPRASGPGGKLLRALGRTLDQALGGAYGLDVDGATVEVAASLHVQNRLFPDAGGVLIEGPILPERLRAVDLSPSRMLLGADTFALHDGGDVHLPGGEAGRGGPFWKQVQRMHLLGHGRRELIGPAEEGLRFLERIFPLRFVTEAQLVSQSYTDEGRDPSRMRCRSRRPVVATGAWRNGDRFGYGGPTPPDGLSAEKCFDTLPLQTRGTARGYDADPSYRALDRRRDRFLGCPAGLDEGDCAP